MPIHFSIEFNPILAVLLLGSDVCYSLCLSLSLAISVLIHNSSHLFALITNESLPTPIFSRNQKPLPHLLNPQLRNVLLLHQNLAITRQKPYSYLGKIRMFDFRRLIALLILIALFISILRLFLRRKIRTSKLKRWGRLVSDRYQHLGPVRVVPSGTSRDISSTLSPLQLYRFCSETRRTDRYGTRLITMIQTFNKFGIKFD